MRGTWEKFAVVVGLLFALAGVILIWVAGATYQRQLRDLREIQEELATIQKRRATYQRLVDNLISYSRVQPNVDALLVPFGFKQVPQQAAQQRVAPPQSSPPPAPRADAPEPGAAAAPAAAPKTGGKK
jgi:hypothetical protein